MLTGSFCAFQQFFPATRRTLWDHLRTFQLCEDSVRELFECLPDLFVGRVAVDFHRHVDLRVSQDPHSNSGVDAEFHKERGAGVFCQLGVSAAKLSLGPSGDDQVC